MDSDDIVKREAIESQSLALGSTFKDVSEDVKTVNCADGGAPGDQLLKYSNEPIEVTPEEMSPQLTLQREDVKPFCADGGVNGAPGDQLLEYRSEVIPEGMSPREWKLVLKKKRRALRKEEAMSRRKEKDRKKRELKRLEKAKSEGKKRSLEDTASLQPRAKRKKMSDESASKLRVAVDLSYEDLMGEKDLRKVMHQCQRCYAVNRRAESPLQLYLTSFGEKTMNIWDKQYSSYRNWDVHREEKGFIELFGKDNVVFLTSDSPNVLTDLEADKVYVIGGLVDHNHHKGYCFEKSLELGLSHAQLPLSQYIKLNCRTVLAVNHVFEILVEYSNGRSWKEAFHKVIPPRKIIGDVSSSSNGTSNEQTEAAPSTGQSDVTDTGLIESGTGTETDAETIFSTGQSDVYVADTDVQVKLEGGTGTEQSDEADTDVKKGGTGTVTDAEAAEQSDEADTDVKKGGTGTETDAEAAMLSTRQSDEADTDVKKECVVDL